MSNGEEYNFVQVKCYQNSYTECWVAYYIWRTVPFLLIGVGTCGNLLNFVVLSRKRMRKYSTCVYLLFLSGSDLVLLWTGTALDANESISGARISDRSTFMCRAVRFFIMTSAGFSVWLLVLLTLERVLLTKLHTSAKGKMTPRNATIASATTLVFTATFTGHLLFGFDLTETEANNSTDTTHGKCDYTSTKYRLFYTETWGLLILLFLNLIPMFIIVLGNLTIAWTIFHQKKKLRRVHPVPVTGVQQQTQRKSPTRTLFVLSGFFLMTTLPYCVYVVITNGLEHLDEHSVAIHQLINAVILMLVYSNFTFNFFLYFVSGTLFKQEWQKLIAGATDKIRSWLRTTGN